MFVLLIVVCITGLCCVVIVLCCGKWLACTGAVWRCIGQPITIHLCSSLLVLPSYRESVCPAHTAQIDKVREVGSILQEREGGRRRREWLCDMVDTGLNKVWWNSHAVCLKGWRQLWRWQTIGSVFPCTCTMYLNECLLKLKTLSALFYRCWIWWIGFE